MHLFLRIIFPAHSSVYSRAVFSCHSGLLLLVAFADLMPSFLQMFFQGIAFGLLALRKLEYRFVERVVTFIYIY